MSNVSPECDLSLTIQSDNKDACNYSPAASVNAVTVGASTLGDERAYFSNHGRCVDVFAPGLNILSTWNTGNQSTNTISGTSMASPYIAGLFAYFLSIHGSATFSITENAIAAQASASIYAKAYSLLPSLAQAVLPVPAELTTPFTFFPTEDGESETYAPVPPKRDTLTPAQLKKALIKLASPGMLSGNLPAGTPNLLAFNNATLSEKSRQ